MLQDILLYSRKTDLTKRGHVLQGIFDKAWACVASVLQSIFDKARACVASVLQDAIFDKARACVARQRVARYI